MASLNVSIVNLKPLLLLHSRTHNGQNVYRLSCLVFVTHFKEDIGCCLAELVFGTNLRNGARLSGYWRICSDLVRHTPEEILQFNSSNATSNQSSEPTGTPRFAHLLLRSRVRRFRP
ncbi:unnamed protein product [Dicrocoelium dendriticum]|nr:unnamed protein product [Dicrocoelium dendriticum]